MEHTNSFGVTRPVKKHEESTWRSDELLHPGEPPLTSPSPPRAVKGSVFRTIKAGPKSSCSSIPGTTRPVCSAEACSFRDRFQDFQDAGAEVIGISADSSDSHRRFAERLHLPFILLSDPDGAVRARYRVPRTFGLIPGRTTFLIDKNGIIQRVFSSQFQPAKHVTEALAALRKLRE